MRWPWVSHDAYDVLSEHYATTLATYRAMAADQAQLNHTMQERYDALLEKFTALRLAGGDDAVPTAPVVRARAEPDPVTQAIISKAKHSLLLRKHYAEYVRRERAKGTEETDIAQAILDGHSDDEEMVFG